MSAQANLLKKLSWSESVHKLIRSGLGALIALASLTSQPGVAQDNYPNKPIRFILGFSAGGGTDVILRTVAAKLSENLAVPVVVENKAGANANIAGEAVAKAAPDGYTFLYNTSSLVLSPHLYSSLNYDFKTQLTPVALTANIPYVLATHPSVPVKSVQEFVTYLKANPGKLNYASSGEGNITHLSTILFLNSVGAQATHIPYKGEAPGLVDLLGGQVQFMIGNSNTMIPYIQQGKLTGLAAASLKRMDAMKNLPTLSETILPGVEYGAWSGVMAPANTPKPVIDKMNAALNKTLQDPAVRERIVASGAEVRGSTVQEYDKFLKAEYERLGQVIKAAGLKPQ
jgi:tripartite-type tricarboxylate transporter receptor subunit TctC